MKRFLLALVFYLVGLAGPLQAQDVPTLANLEISVWPEYDRPEVLVIYRGMFAVDTPLPVPVEIYLPARVGQPSAVAWVNEGGQQFNQQFTTRVEGDWLVVSFELDTTRFQVEYYDLLSVDPAGQRQYTFSYTADYPINSLAVEFQVPPTADGYTLDPSADSVISGPTGLVYHLADASSLALGDGRSWTFTYKKASADLTVSAFTQPAVSAPEASPAAEDADNSTVLVFFVAFVALIGVGAGAFWLGRRTQPAPEAASPTSPGQKRRGSGRGAGGETASRGQRQRLTPAGSEGVLFCAQCGAELRPDSDYCHRCGTPVCGR